MSDTPGDIDNPSLFDGGTDAPLGNDIPSMLLPLLGEFLLVPNVTVAEMAPIQPFDIIPNTPDWFLGYYPWRNLRIPIVSYETMNGVASPKISARGRVAVLNNTGQIEDDNTGFISILTQDIPRMTRVEEQDISENPDIEKRPFDLMNVRVGLEELVIPDIAAIERAIDDLNLLR
jgi:chemosensory pili system protein ChpC